MAGLQAAGRNSLRKGERPMAGLAGEFAGAKPRTARIGGKLEIVRQGWRRRGPKHSDRSLSRLQAGGRSPDGCCADQTQCRTRRPQQARLTPVAFGRAGSRS